jgi:hypothetical protein
MMAAISAIILTAAIKHQPVLAQITGATPASPATPNGVLILSHSEAGSDFGSLYIVGEVKNNLSTMVNYVQIVGTFYDAGGSGQVNHHFLLLPLLLVFFVIPRYIPG